MKMYKKILSFALLLVSFTIIFSDCYTLSFSNFSVTKSCSTCPDLSDHSEHSHRTEYNITIFELNCNTNHLKLSEKIILNSDLFFKNNFISEIWQPPKIS